MVAQDKFQRGLARLKYAFGVGKHFHAFVDGVNATCNKVARALDFHHAHTACAYFVYTLKVAQRGDFDTDTLCRGKDGRARFDGNGDVVYFEIDHFLLPPYFFSTAWNLHTVTQLPHLTHLPVSMTR